MAITADELIDKARDQRRRERYQEAAVSARRATEQDPDKAEAWWELGFALLNSGDLSASAEAFEQLTELAPRFAPGWEFYGLVLSDLGKAEAAERALKTAFELGMESRNALRVLADRYAATDNGDGEYAVMKRMQELGFLQDSNAWNRLGILHSRHAHYHDAIIAYRKSASFKDDPASFFNLGLAYAHPEISQDVDAIDVWRLVLHRFPGQLDRAQQKIDGLLPRLLKLALAAQAAGASLLEPEQWYSTYLNPFELLNVGRQVDLSALDARALQRLKKQLMAEIELEEGRISWLGNHVVDRSRAIALCEELNDEHKKLAHWRVYQDSQLLGFMSRGEHAFFTMDAQRSPLDLLEQLEDPNDSFASWLSPLFARQYNLVLGKALERHCLSVIEAMFDGRRWVTPEDSDQCFEIALRQVEALLQSLRTAAESAAKVKPELTRLQKLLAGKEIAILNLLPTPFRAQQDAAAKLFRDISLAAHNVHGDSNLANQVLELTKRFQFKSADLNHQLEEDRQTLRKLIEEQRKYEAHLTTGGQIWKITKDFLQLGARQVATRRIQALCWGVLIDNGACEFTFRFLDEKADEVTFSWRASRDMHKQQEHFNKLLQAALAYVMPHVVERIDTQLQAGKTVHIGPCRVTQQGVVFERKGWFFSKQCAVPWPQVNVDLHNGEVIIVRDRLIPKNKISLPMRNTFNAPVLHFLATRATEGA